MKDNGVVCLIMRPILFFLEEERDKRILGKKKILQEIKEQKKRFNFFSFYVFLQLFFWWGAGGWV